MIKPRWLKRPSNFEEIPDGYVVSKSGNDVAFVETTSGPESSHEHDNLQLLHMITAPYTVEEQYKMVNVPADTNTSLSGKAERTHLHPEKEDANPNIQQHIIMPHAPAGAQINADITKAEIEAKLTGAITSHTHAGGSDPWQVVKLASDFTISTTGNNNVTNFYFTPAINKSYLIQGYFLLRTATATVGARPGLAWPTNLTDGASNITVPNSNTAWAFRSQGAKTTQNALCTGLPTTVDSYLAELRAYIITSGTTSGNIQITLASETAGTNVTMKAGSILMYREI